MTIADTDFWAPFFPTIGHHRATEPDVSVGERRYALFVRDARRPWRVDEALPAPPGRPGAALSRETFADAVRAALRDLGRMDLLAGNPLLALRQVRERGGEPEALRATLSDAAAVLRVHPRDEKLFEGFTDELVAGCAETGDELAQARWLFSGQRLARTTTGRTVLYLSRPMLEGHLRARVRAIRSVTVVDGCDVLGLTSTTDRQRVTGVHVLDRAAGSAARTLAADLVLATRPTSATATSGCPASPPACWYLGMQCARSTQSTPRA